MSTPRRARAVLWPAQASGSRRWARAPGSALALALALGLLEVSAGLTAIGLGGCRRTAAPATATLPVRVTRIIALGPEDWTAAGLPAAGPPGLGPEQLRGEAERGLRRAGMTVAAEQPEGADAAGAQPGDFELYLGLRVMHVAPTADSEGKGLMRVAAVGRLVPRVPPPSPLAAGTADSAQSLARQIDHVALVEKKYSGITPDGATWATQARKAAERASFALGSQLKLLGLPSAALTALLGDPAGELEVRKLAAELLGERHESAALPVLIPILKDKAADAELRDAAMGALVRIGDRQAVRPLIDAVAFADRFEMGKLLEAVAALGGDEARSYLTFVQKSHPEPRLRQEATAALQHLEQREARAREAHKDGE